MEEFGYSDGLTTKDLFDGGFYLLKKSGGIGLGWLESHGFFLNFWNIKGVEIGLRDLLPFVGSTENGQTIGTPAALQSAARGERLIKGGSLQTATLTPDTQSMVADVATAGLAGPAFKGVKNIIKVLK